MRRSTTAGRGCRVTGLRRAQHQRRARGLPGGVKALHQQAAVGVQRLLVDTQARTLAAKPLLPVDGMLNQGLWSQRLMHSGEQLLHLVGGELLQHGW